MTSDLKIIVVGPPKSGKTEIADILSSASKGFTGTCTPTIGLRVLEFQTTLEVLSNTTNIVVQLWDVSGDEKYMSCWPAIAKDADGCLLVYSAYDKKQAHALEHYSREFCKDLTSKQCLCVAHKTIQSEEKASRPKLAKNIEDTKTVPGDAKEIEPFNTHFMDFLSTVYQIKTKLIEEKEKKLVGDNTEQNNE